MKRYCFAFVVMMVVLAGWACGDDDSSKPCGSAAGSCSDEASVASGQGALVFPAAAKDGPTLGKASAAVKADLWVNYLCPHCREFVYSSLPQIVANYVETGKVALTLHDAAVGPQSAETAGEAAACANDQGKFWEAVDALYHNFSDNEKDYVADKIPDRLAGAGLDIGKVSDCIAAHSHQADVQSDVSAFQSLNAQQLPVLVVNGKAVVGISDYSQAQKLFDEALSR